MFPNSLAAVGQGEVSGIDRVGVGPTAQRDKRATTAPLRRSRIIAIGLVGALLLIAAASLYLAFVNPPYSQWDEPAHVGYVLSVRRGVQPSIDTAIPSEVLDVAGGEQFRQPDIYVANNPPFPYLFALPFTELTTRSGAPAGPLLGMRIFSIATATAAVGIAFLLGRELGGRDEFVGLVTAGVLAGTISISQISSVANVDGPAFLATTGVTWMLARFARGRAPRDALWLGLWAAAAAAVRPMSLVYAVVACAIALFLGWRADGRRTVLPLTLRLAAPTVLITGWFYVLNVYRYGDPTGSQALFEKLELSHGQSFFSLLTGPGPFIHTFPTDAVAVYGRYLLYPFHKSGWDYLTSAVAVALVVGAIILAFVTSRRDTVAGRRPTLVPSAWVGSAILAVVPVVLTAQHMSGGGAGHPRYLLPMLPIVAGAAALLATRVSRWLSAAVVCAFVVAELTRLRAAGHLSATGANVFGMPTEGTVGQPFVALAVVVAVLGAALLLGALLRLAVNNSQRT
jgi:4-amino-4-deoxy-L-arabinose transferase-like glycosyltransferase